MVEAATAEISRLEKQLRRDVGIQVHEMAELHSLCERRDQKILAQAQEYAEINGEPLELVAQHGTWAVTESGVEHLFREHYRHRQGRSIERDVADPHEREGLG